jgi:glutaredoxin
MRNLIAALLLGLLAGAVQGQQIYRWVDADGKVRYTAEKPPAGVQSKPLESRVQSYSGTPTVSQGPAGAAAPGLRPAVKMYATDWCGYCKQARQFFARSGIRYTELDIEKSAAAHAEYKNLGGRGVPVILVGAQRMDGFGEARLSQMLKAAGY